MYRFAFMYVCFFAELKEMANNVYTPSREVVKPIETKLEQCQMATLTPNPEQQSSFDDDDDETIPYERYSQYRDQQEQMDREYIQRTDRDRSSE